MGAASSAAAFSSVVADPSSSVLERGGGGPAMLLATAVMGAVHRGRGPVLWRCASDGCFSALPELRSRRMAGTWPFFPAAHTGVTICTTYPRIICR